MPRDPQTSPDPTAPIRLFRHSKRPKWGIAALIWERDGKRGYQFSDGKLRVFKEGFYGLFESATAPGDGSAKTVRRLARLAQSENVTEATRLPTLRDQIELFRIEFAGGFAGKSWQAKHRGCGSAGKRLKRLKRHRDAAVEEAVKLSKVELDAAIANHDWVGIHARMIEVASSTDLVPRAQVRKLEKVRPTRELAMALYDWLHTDADEVAEDRQFNAFVRELRDAAGWQLATCFGALVYPDRHTCVRTSSFTLQGKMLLSQFSVGRRPAARDYRRLCHVAEIVRRELTEAELPPADLLDVHDFMWFTLRPAARDSLLAVPLVRAKEVEAAEEAEAAEAAKTAEAAKDSSEDSSEDVAEAA